MMKDFFSIYNIFYTHQAFLFHLVVDFCIAHDHVTAFSLFRKIFIYLLSFFCILYFLF